MTQFLKHDIHQQTPFAKYVWVYFCAETAGNKRGWVDTLVVDESLFSIIDKSGFYFQKKLKVVLSYRTGYHQEHITRSVQLSY